MFTTEQLQIIKEVARSKKNQGELSVIDAIMTDPEKFSVFLPEQIKVIEYCAQECKRQRSGEMSVYNMVNAWDYATSYADGEELVLDQSGNEDRVNLDFISHLGALVEPHKNPVREQNSFRRIPIGVTDGRGGWIEKAKWEEVPRLLELLLESYYEDGFHASGMPYHPLAQTAEDEFYFNYQEIHPFVDGNGRTGKILYNFLKGTLSDPVMPPNFWGSSNP